MSSVRQVVYVSAAFHLLSEGELLDLLQTSRRRNAENNVTGLLLYLDGSFMQALEGPSIAIDVTLGRIRADSRHHSLTIILDEASSERSFNNWTMGFHHLMKQEAEEDFRISDFLEVPRLDTEPGDVVHRLLKTFRETSGR